GRVSAATRHVRPVRRGGGAARIPGTGGPVGVHSRTMAVMRGAAGYRGAGGTVSVRSVTDTQLLGEVRHLRGPASGRPRLAAPAPTAPVNAVDRGLGPR